MSLCAYCGSASLSNGLCAFHTSTEGEGWAEGNRRLCDFFHRGRPLERVSEPERADSIWAAASPEE